MMTDIQTTPELNAIICDLLRDSEHLHVRYAVARIEELEREVDDLQTQQCATCGYTTCRLRHQSDSLLPDRGCYCWHAAVTP
jgi:hypothetical protein